MNGLGQYLLRHPRALVVLVILGLIGLPLALWKDLEALSDQNLERQARSVNSMISGVRSYYARNVVSRVLSTDGATVPLHNYRDVPGAIPIPATLSLELGEVIGANEAGVTYRFVSDYPFRNRPAHNLSPFETRALATFRSGTAQENGPQILIERAGSLLSHTVNVATPVIMSGPCVDCHNTHPESTKTDWKVGDVRGIQTVSVRQPVSLDIWSFKWLLLYLLVAGSAGFVVALLQYRLASGFSRVNDELEANNDFLAGISMKLSKYLSPQVYKSIFSGEKDVAISTERKKLTVFFADIKDFTATTEQLQPEELTALLNEYFTEMARIAETHGATIDKFIGDAIVAFFGDPESRGAKGDAEACVRMALDMQRRLSELQTEWRARGQQHPFNARMGINTGYCNVGNFGSEDRMDYTIIGAEANLAARMQTIAEPGGIVMSYETYVLAQDLVDAEPMPPVAFKGLAREVVPYRVTAAKGPEANADPRAATPTLATGDDGTVTLSLHGLDEATRKRALDAMRAALRESLKQDGN